MSSLVLVYLSFTKRLKMNPEYLMYEMDEIESEAHLRIGRCETREEVEDLQRDLLGRTGRVGVVLRRLSEISPTARSEVGQRANDLILIIRGLLDGARGGV